MSKTASKAANEPTITDATWPRHADGRRKKMGELTHAQQVAVVRGAVAAIAPQFAAIGVAVTFQDGPPPKSIA